MVWKCLQTSQLSNSEVSQATRVIVFFTTTAGYCLGLRVFVVWRSGESVLEGRPEKTVVRHITGDVPNSVFDGDIWLQTRTVCRCWELWKLLAGPGNHVRLTISILMRGANLPCSYHNKALSSLRNPILVTRHNLAVYRISTLQNPVENGIKGVLVSSCQPKRLFHCVNS